VWTGRGRYVQSRSVVMRDLMLYLKGKGVWRRADISSVESPSDSVAHYIAFETGIIG